VKEKVLLEKLIYDFESKKLTKRESLSFFWRNPTTYKVLLDLMKSHYEEFDLNIEKLFLQNAHLASRITINNIIKDATQMKLVEIKLSKNDQRKKNIYPSEKLVNEFSNWLLNIFS